jgi:hypothetical protein
VRCGSSVLCPLSYQLFQDRVSESPVLPNSQPWPWPDALDALVAAPACHQLLTEDRRVRVLHTRIAAGDVVPLHTHRWGGSLTCKAGDTSSGVERRGEILFARRQAGEPPKTPALNGRNLCRRTPWKNLGPLEISILMIERKD